MARPSSYTEEMAPRYDDEITDEDMAELLAQVAHLNMESWEQIGESAW